jgi:HEAT repeat protein
MANKAFAATKTRHTRLANSPRRSQQPLLALLAGGDRRSIGRANQVAAAVLQSPRLFSELIQGLWSTDSLVRMRAADAVEKISRQKPDLLRRYKRELLGLLRETPMTQLGRPRAELRCNRSGRIGSQGTTQAVWSEGTKSDEKEMRWHLALLAARLPLNAKERAIAIAALKNYLKDRSSIVRTFALQALADLAEQAPDLLPEVIELLHEAVRAGTAAMRARSRKLLLRLERQESRE